MIGPIMRAALCAAVAVICVWPRTEATAKVLRFVCSFDNYVSPKTRGITRGSTLRYEFVIDGTGHAFAVGKNVYPVRVFTGSRSLTFLEELESGAIQSTTIHERGRAVHSRHTIFDLGDEDPFVPSQYYGTCKAR